METKAGHLVEKLSSMLFNIEHEGNAQMAETTALVAYHGTELYRELKENLRGVAGLVDCSMD